MDVFDTRRNRLRQLIAERYEGRQASFAEAIGREPNYVSRMLSASDHRKKIGERLARQIEATIRLPERWLDGVTVKQESAREAAVLYGIAISQEAVHLACEWDKLEPPVREQVQSLIETLVATQVRRQRAAQRGAGETHEQDDLRPVR